KAWGIDIGIEAGAVKPENCSGDTLVNVAEDAVQNTQANGGTVRFIAMDEPFIGGQLTVGGQNCNFTMQQSAAQTAHFVQALQGQFLYIVVGDIEPYPYFSVAQMEAWISLLQSLGVQLAFFHLDVDPALVAANGTDLAGDLQALRAFCQAQNIPFGVLLNSLTATSDTTYYSDAIHFTQSVKAAIVKPQISIFQSFDCATGTCNTPINLPENDPSIFSHTRLITYALAILNQERARCRGEKHRQLGQFGATHAGAIERHQQCSSKQSPGCVDQTRDFFWTEHSWQSASVFGIGQELPKLMSLERLYKEEPQSGYTVDRSAGCHLALSEQVSLITSQLIGSDRIWRLAKR